MRCFLIILAICFQGQVAGASTFFSSASYHTGDSLVTDQPYIRISNYIIPHLESKSIDFIAQLEQFVIYDGHFMNSSGFGLRALSPSIPVVFGVNSFFDFCNVPVGTFHQISGGVEFLTPLFDLHLNYYQPLGNATIVSSAIYDNYVGNYTIQINDESYLCRAWDCLLAKSFLLGEQVRVYAGIGGYFVDDLRSNTALGFQARAEVWWNSFVYFSYYRTQDKLFDARNEFSVGLSVPVDQLFSLLSGNGFHLRPKRLDWKMGQNFRIPRIGNAGIWGLDCSYSGQNY